MLRAFFLIFILAVIAVVSLAGFRGTHSAKPPIEIFVDMVRNPRYDPQHESDFYSDTRAGRPPVPGTALRGPGRRPRGQAVLAAGWSGWPGHAARR